MMMDDDSKEVQKVVCLLNKSFVERSKENLSTGNMVLFITFQSKVTKETFGWSCKRMSRLK
jgi:hypothetical protein